MAGEHRTAIDTVEPLLAELEERIRAFDFVAAVRLLENASPEKPRVGDAVRIRDDVVRLSQHLGLGFHGHALHSLNSDKAGRPPRMHVNFMGLLGSQGPMPLHLSEYADQRERHHADPTFREFLDLFNHRMISLFYKASVQFDPVVSADRQGDNPYEQFLGALTGVMPTASRDRDSLPNQFRRFHPGWFGQTARPPDGLVALIREHFDLPATVREWVGGWLPLSDDARISLGRRASSSQPGRAMYLGKRVWSIRHRFQVCLGPLEWQDFQSFKPGSPRARQFHDLVRHYTGDEWDWDLELQLQPSDIPPMGLDRRHALGIDSWLRGSDRGRPAQQRVFINRRVLASAGHSSGSLGDAVAAHHSRQEAAP